MTRLSGYFLPTEKQAPADAEALSHKLLVRAGMVRQVGAGPVELAAGRLARAPAHRAGRAGGDERHRRPGAADAGAQPGGAVAEVRPLPVLRRRAVPLRGPPRGAHGAGHDPRGGRDHARRAGRALLPRPAAHPLPLPGQGARRAAPARRRPAHARVRHEGRLHVRPRRRRGWTRATASTSRPTTGSSTGWGSSGTGWSPTSGRWAARARTSTWRPARRGRTTSRWRPATPPTSRWRAPRRSPSSSRRRSTRPSRSRRRA